MNLDTPAPTFSVVIPTFNRAHVIGRAIRSVQRQTFQDFEILVVDDGSTDETRQVVSDIGDSRLQYIHQPNGGAPRARNTGIEQARGKYIAFLDSDDEWLPEHLANALPVLESGENICTYTQVISDRGNNVTFLRPPRSLHPGEDISEYYLCDRGFVQTTTLVVPAALARAVKYDEQIGAGDDMDFAIRLAYAGAQLVMLPQPGAIFYDWHVPGRLSRHDNLEERLAWLERMRPIITERAYYGELGWRIAKKYTQRGQRKKALWLYFQSVRRRCYSPKLAISVFLQVFLSPEQYRKFSDFIARLGVRP